tara:strand:- start:8464 stop:8577 length:114 start_codon:yes stop_codon:yes gene_type:complete
MEDRDMAGRKRRRKGLKTRSRKRGYGKTRAKRRARRR